MKKSLKEAFIDKSNTFLEVFRNLKKCTRCPEHVRKEIEDYMLAKKTQKNQMSFGSQNVNEDMFGFQDEDDEDLEVTSKMGGKDVSSGGSNVGGSGGSGSGSCLKRPRQKGLMGNLFTPNPEMVVQNRKKILKLPSTMPTRKRPRRELIYYFVNGCMMS